MKNELYKEIKNNFVPLPFPDSPYFYDNLCLIFQMISKHIFRENNKKYKYFAFLAKRWIQETPYKSLLEGKIRYNIKYNIKIGKTIGTEWKKFVNKQIDDLDDEIEQKIKYEYTRALKCYSDITESIRQKVGDDKPYCKALPIFLEAGTCNRNTIFLLELGFSRTIAIKIAHLMDYRGMKNSTECISWLKLNKQKIMGTLPVPFHPEIDELFKKYKL